MKRIWRDMARWRFQPTLPARGATSFGVHRQNTNYFNPRSPHGERQIEYLSARGEDDFNPRSPHGERLNLDTDGFQREMISTHAPRTGSDTLHKSAPRSTFRFQPTLPARGATGLLRFFLRFSAFQPTLPARGATILCLQVEQNNLFQPTLPARGATASARTGDRFAPHFNPRSPHGERRLMKIVKMNPAAAFQPTLPARGATSPHCPNRIGSPISTHAPRTGSDSQGQAPRGNLAISTHAPRTGSDDDGKPTWQPFAQFQPTLPARGATVSASCTVTCRLHFNPRSPHGERRWRGRDEMVVENFNPRSPHGERRQCGNHHGNHQRDFNPRSPHGERQLSSALSSDTFSFQPTLPARGATVRFPQPLRPPVHFNPRSPHGERLAHSAESWRTCYFNPRSPHGERPCIREDVELFVDISTHAPRTGSDVQHFWKKLRTRRISTHAPRTGSDKRADNSLACAGDFNPRSPHGERRMFFALTIPKIEFQPTLPARGATLLAYY